MKLPKIITAVMMVIALCLVILLVNLTKEQERRTMPVVVTGGIVSEVKSVSPPVKPVMPPKPEIPAGQTPSRDSVGTSPLGGANKPMVSQTVPLVVNDSATLGNRSNDELVPIKKEKADGKWYLAVEKASRLIRVDLARQRVLFYRDGKLIYEFQCSSSVTGKIMPPDKHPDLPHDHIGVYGVLGKYKKRWSNEYDVWMPWALLYHSGHLIHATDSKNAKFLGQRASHGCIRLSLVNAKTLYAQVQIGDPVEVE